MLDVKKVHDKVGLDIPYEDSAMDLIESFYAVVETIYRITMEDFEIPLYKIVFAVSRQFDVEESIVIKPRELRTFTKTDIIGGMVCPIIEEDSDTMFLISGDYYDVVVTEAGLDKIMDFIKGV